MTNEGKWLYIEPYVHFTERDGHVLFYNTLSRKFIEYTNIGVLTELTQILLKEENGYVIPLSKSTLQNQVVKKFISKIEILHMGGLLPMMSERGKPVNLLPIPTFRKSLSRYDDPKAPQKIDAKDYLHELFIHLNAGDSPLTRAFPQGFNQFTFPCSSEVYGKEMDFQLLDKLMMEVSQLYPLSINILGIDPFGFTRWEELQKKLSNSALTLTLHLTPEQAVNTFTNKDLARFSLSIMVAVPITPSDETALEKLEKTKPASKKIDYNFIISGLDTLVQALELAEKYQLTSWFLKPYLSEGNFPFFEENVFITKEAITGSKPNQKQIFSRITFNENDFGKFTMMPDGTIFANINDPSMGNFRDSGITSLISAELQHGKSWRRSRQTVDPCSHCVYHFLCPPISSYEILTGRFNFCHIYKGER